ncbi:methylmalonyl-CoA epimerase [Desulfonema ishimotonii]|uniref:Methylmalonyl-CoA epimerase n=1 Tax=Desulfonema ishimotonii TaxID=45657 RepID=A0A401FUA4_9BACT|nr:VOC family protein [Desulfonema ishimotonii]GBC60535.1 methylmalonyl-CoA epimerase [Desulfonema ishimotonii]
MISRIDHVSIAVRDPENALNFFRKIFGAVPGASGSDGQMKYSWRILSAGDLSRLELIAPTGEGSFLDNFLKEKAAGVHHITFETPDIRQAKAALEAHKIPFFGFSDRDPAWKELFIHPRDAFGVLIQIAEFRPDEWLDESVIFPEGRRWAAEKNTEGGTLTLAHPGGGKVAIELNRDEIETLVSDLEKLL